MNIRTTQKEQILAEKYNGQETAGYFADLKRLDAGEPFEYVLGHAEFLGCHIDLRYKPMVPRYETAFWVARAIDELKSIDRPLRLADTFSGSGNVGVALLRHLPRASVDFTEFDTALLPQIRLNCELNGIDPARYRIMQGDALSALTEAYDAIFAVPPYVAPEALPELDPEMINFEPHLAFFAEENGTAFHRLLIEKAYDFLSEGGTLYMEADMDQDAGIRTMVAGTKWKKLELWEDPYGATPNVVLRK